MEERRENIMGTQPINRLLPSMAFPIMLSMLVQALYNVVDSVFVADAQRKRTDQREPGLSGAEPDDRRGRGHRRGHQRAFVPPSWVKKTLTPPIKVAENGVLRHAC